MGVESELREGASGAEEHSGRKIHVFPDAVFYLRSESPGAVREIVKDHDDRGEKRRHLKSRTQNHVVLA
jgi:hypothetical protein